jgi:hypothetical protein
MHTRCSQCNARPRKRYPRTFPSGYEDKLDLAKTLGLEDGADVGFESFWSKLTGVMVVVEECLGDSGSLSSHI